MYDETGPDGKRRYTVAHIAAEFGVTRPNHLPPPPMFDVGLGRPAGRGRGVGRRSTRT
jgi:hypothetical protein